MVQTYLAVQWPSLLRTKADELFCETPYQKQRCPQLGLAPRRAGASGPTKGPSWVAPRCGGGLAAGARGGLGERGAPAPQLRCPLMRQSPRGPSSNERRFPVDSVSVRRGHHCLDERKDSVLFPHDSGGWRSAGLASPEASLHASLVVTFPLWPHVSITLS